MAKMFGMCFNWKVLVALGVVGIGIWVVAPNAVLKALPFLLLAACPLSMLVMAWAMKRGMAGTHHDSPKPARVDPRERLAALESNQAALQREIAQVRSEIDQPEPINRAAVRAKGHDAG
jgi:hypothetical protein